MVRALADQTAGFAAERQWAVVAETKFADGLVTIG